MSSRRDQFLIVSSESDPIARGLSVALQGLEIIVCQVASTQLGDLVLTLSPSGLMIDRRPVGGMLLQCSPGERFTTSFVQADQSFCDAEMSAILLAATGLRELFVVNRYDAITWFDGLHWAGFRASKEHSSVPYSPVHLGETSLSSGGWIPFTSFFRLPFQDGKVRRRLGTATFPEEIVTTIYWVMGQLMDQDGETISTVRTPELSLRGIGLAELNCDAFGRVITVNAVPRLPDGTLAQRIGTLIAEGYEAHCYSRRS